MANLYTVPNLGAKYLFFVSSRSVKMRELSFPQKVNKLSKARFSWQDLLTAQVTASKSNNCFVGSISWAKINMWLALQKLRSYYT